MALHGLIPWRWKRLPGADPFARGKPGSVRSAKAMGAIGRSGGGDHRRGPHGPHHDHLKKLLDEK